MPNPPALSVVPTPALEVKETFSLSELCSTAGLTTKQVSELESFGPFGGKGSGSSAVYAASDVAIAMSFAGHMNIELIQPNDGNPSVYKEAIDARGYGFHHWGIACTDVDAEVRRYQAMGMEEAFLYQLVDVLVREMPRVLRCAFISQDDLFSGRWQHALQAAVTAAAVGQSRSVAGSGPVEAVMKDFRETPTSSGKPSAASRSNPASNCKLCSARLAKPIPGSMISRSLPTPHASARSMTWSTVRIASSTVTRWLSPQVVLSHPFRVTIPWIPISAANGPGLKSEPAAV